MWRSIVAIASGLLAMIVIAGLMLMILGIVYPKAIPNSETVPSLAWAAFILLYYLFAAAAGGYLTSHLAVGSKFRHVQVLGILVLLLGLVQLWAGWNKQPAWYLIAQLLIGLIGVILGGSLLRRHAPDDRSGRSAS